ncbi:hypothetical protein O181_003711 [Austropuccinia psidii MF-1]|uniref:Uncharacterized protein n=1 Tax=Austropuccinia psidii MF-1 TaxID=1389203 RepID=A0A9Q3BE66_9BASI|nr:hypothetical protein [Austropuccinia psidii MF-1]
MPSIISGASYIHSSSSQKGYRCDYGRRQSVSEGQGSVNEAQTDKLCHSEAYNTVLPPNRSETTTRSLSGIIQSQPECIQQCTSSQRVSDPGRPVKKLHELLLYCEEVFREPQHLQITEWIASIDGKEENDSFNSRMELEQPSTTQTDSKTIPSGQKQKLKSEKEVKSSEQGQGQSTSQKTIHPRLQNPKDSSGCHGKCVSDDQNHDGNAEKGGIQIKISEMISGILDEITAFYIAINDLKNHIYDRSSTICNNLKKSNLSSSQK